MATEKRENDIEAVMTDSLIPQKTEDKILSKRSSKKVKNSSNISSKKKAKRLSSQQHGSFIKYGSLVLLITQMVGLVLLMRYSRTGKDEQLYLASTAVFFMEMMKFITCNVVVFFQSGKTVAGLFEELHTHVWMSPYEVLKLCVPSFLYTIQNNLLYYALSNLDAATYQVCYQLKILTTALFSMCLLNRKFSTTKWSSLLILTVGVIIVETIGKVDGGKVSTAESNQNRILGLIAVLCAACTSGFSGVYFEKILKGSKTSLWIRNIQMGLPSTIIAFATVLVHDGATVASKGFLVGYTPLVWLVVIIQAIGGLIVAVVVKYTDNVAKVFATSISIIVTGFLSLFLFDFHPSFWFCVGSFFVMTATVLYGQPEKRKKSILPTTRK